MIKTICQKKPTANIILDCKKLKAAPTKIRNMQGWPLPLLLFNVILEVPSNARQEVCGRGDTVFFHRWHVIYIENLKELIKTPRLISFFFFFTCVCPIVPVPFLAKTVFSLWYFFCSYVKDQSAVFTVGSLFCSSDQFGSIFSSIPPYSRYGCEKDFHIIWC